jgi:hypothetical protein
LDGVDGNGEGAIAARRGGGRKGAVTKGGGWLGAGIRGAEPSGRGKERRVSNENLGPNRNAERPRCGTREGKRGMGIGEKWGGGKTCT